MRVELRHCQDSMRVELSHCQVSDFLMMIKRISNLVSTEWLGNNLGNVKVLDCSWHLGLPTKNIEDYRLGHIPGSCFFDIDKISDQSTDLPHMLPTVNVANIATVFCRMYG